MSATPSGKPTKYRYPENGEIAPHKFSMLPAAHIDPQVVNRPAIKQNRNFYSIFIVNYFIWRRISESGNEARGRISLLQPL